MSKIIGIDLGTTNSAVAIREGKETKVLINKQGNRTTPSVVAFMGENEKVVGMVAKRQQVTNPKNTVYSAKRFMGRRHDEILNEEKTVSYQIVGDSDEMVRIRANEDEYMPQQIGAMILKEMKDIAEEYLGEKVEKAVITVPAYFNDSQRQATKEAGEIAGLTVERIINEPTAAALAYGLDGKKSGKVLVLDFGGGTFDVSILDIGDGVFEVLSTNGDTHLGGDDIDDALISYFAEEFKKSDGIDLRKDPMALQRLKEAAEKAKCDLSNMMETSINLPFITADENGPKHMNLNISRARFNQICESIFGRIVKPCEMALSDANLTASDIDEVVLVGGTTRIPAVRDIVKNIFGKNPDTSVNPDEVVAMGAAIQGSILAGDSEDSMVLLDVTPLSLGVETMGGVMTNLIDRNTTIPTEKKEVFSTAVDNQPSVTIHVLQGERQFASDNRTLGRFDLNDIPPSPRGVPQIEVAFNIDVNGILSVTAKDLATNKSQTITIKESGTLSEEDIKKMKDDAERYADQDKKKKDLVDAKNNAEVYIYRYEKLVRENESMSDSEKSTVQSAIDNIRSSLSLDDKTAIDKAVSDANEMVNPIISGIYERQNERNNSDYSPSEEGEVIDAEIVE